MEGVVNSTPRPLPRGERHDTHCTGGWMGPRVGLDGCGKSRIKKNICAIFLKHDSHIFTNISNRVVQKMLFKLNKLVIFYPKFTELNIC
jgi:hypothetical protein